MVKPTQLKNMRKQLAPVFQLDATQFPKDVKTYRDVLSGLPGLDPQTYRSLAEKADEGSKLNAALALMQAGFSSMGATPQEGESPFATVGRTLLAPLSANLGKVAAEKRASQEKYKLAEMAAEGKLSSTAFTAALGGNKEVNAALLSLLKNKKSNLEGGVFNLVNPGGKVEATVRLGKDGGLVYVDGTPVPELKKKIEEGYRVEKQFATKAPSKPFGDTVYNVLSKDGTIVPGIQLVRKRGGGWANADTKEDYNLKEKEETVQLSKTPITRKGIDSPEYQPVFKDFMNKLPTFSDRYGKKQKGSIFRKAGKWMYYDNNLNEKEVPEDGQKDLDKKLKLSVYALHPDFGKGLQVSETETLQVPDIIAENFFRDATAIGQSWVGDEFADFSMAAGPQSIRYGEAQTQIVNTNDSPNNILQALTYPASPRTSGSGMGRMVDIAKVNPSILGDNTLKVGDNAAIIERLTIENAAKTLPSNATNLTKADAVTSQQRVAIIQKAAADETAKMQKNWDKKQNLLQTERWQTALKNIKLIDNLTKNMRESNVTGFVTGPIREFLTSIGIPKIDPTRWFETEAGKQAREEFFGQINILKQIVGRGLLKESGDSRFSDKDLSGIQRVLGSINNATDINTVKLKQLRKLFMNGLKSSAKRLGSFNVNDTEIEDAIKLGLDRSVIQADPTAPVFYSKYLNPFKYKVTKQNVPVVSKEDSDQLKIRSVFELFSRDNKRVVIQPVRNVNGVIQPAPGNPKRISIDKLFSDPLWKDHLDYNYKLFKERAGR